MVLSPLPRHPRAEIIPWVRGWEKHWENCNDVKFTSDMMSENTLKVEKICINVLRHFESLNETI